MFSSLQPYGLQYTRLPCLSLFPGVCSNSWPLSQWCHPTISSSVAPFSFCPQSFPASGSFPVSQFFVLGSKNRKQKSRMAVAKRQGREKPVKTEQRKVQEPEWGPQVEQTALLASPIYIGQAQGEDKTYKEEPKGSLSLSPSCWHAPQLFSLHVFGWACPQASRMDSPAIF